MSRVQLALNVADIDAAVEFYSKLFGTEPAKRRPHYANFAITEPPLKLVLIEDAGQTPGTLNHLGVEVESSDEVTAAQDRLAREGLATAWRSRPPAVTRFRTRSGCTDLAASPGRSTPSSQTLRCPARCSARQRPGKPFVATPIQSLAPSQPKPARAAD